jgi:hypothetical protein
MLEFQQQNYAQAAEHLSKVANSRNEAPLFNFWEFHIERTACRKP